MEVVRISKLWSISGNQQLFQFTDAATLTTETRILSLIHLFVGSFIHSLIN